MANPHPPTAQLIPFTSETAQFHAIKAVQVRSELIRNGKNYIKSIQAKPQKHPQDKELNRQIRLTNEQVSHMRKVLNGGYCKHCERSGPGPKEIASLVRELRGLMEHLCRLRGIGEPARVRPVNDPRQQRRAAMPRLAIEVPATTSGVPTPPQEPELPK